jgi:hypothetical protein
MPHERRRATMLAALDAGDDATICSILNEPAFVSGLEPGDLVELRHRWAGKHKSAELARLARLEKTRDAMTRGASLLMQYSTALYARADAVAAMKLQDEALAAISAALPTGAA